MIRSMSDEQIEAAEIARHGVGFDKQPWDNHAGNRSGIGPAIGWWFAPRPECIPSPDPQPWIHVHNCPADQRRTDMPGVFDVYSPRPWGSFIPDPEFVRSDVNPILSAFRDEIEPMEARLDRWILVYLLKDKSAKATDVRRVLTRLRNVTEANNV